MAENKKIIAVHKSREILLDILKTRGFNTEEYSGFSISEIHAMFANKQLDILLKSGTKEETNEGTKEKEKENEEEEGKEEGKKIYIKYYLEKTIRPTNVHEIIDDLFNIESILNTNDDLIIIIKDEPNDTLQKLQSYIYEHDKIFVTIINIERLQFNITQHCLVPTHRVLTDLEASEIIKKYNIVDNLNIPGISRFEPISQVLGIRPTQLVEIERSSKTAITSLFYRICI